MKYLALCSLFLIGCNEIGSKENNRIIREAHDYCKCHDGVAGFLFDDSSYDLKCKDGTHAEERGIFIEDEHLYAECDKK